MRRALANRELAGLCASCAQRRLAPAAATASRSAGLASRTYSTPSTSQRAATLSSSQAHLPQRRLAATTNQQRRYISGTSPAPRPTTTSPAEEREEKEEEKHNTPKTQSSNKPLPYYALFPQTLPDGAPPDGPFDIDVRALRREYLQLQAASHPDYYHSARDDNNTTTTDTSKIISSSSSSHSEPRRRAEALSSHINSAYRTLSSPLLRAQYVLAERHGVDLAGDEASRVSGPADPELLMEVMEAREAVDEARGEGDLEGVSAENDGRIAESVGRLGRALERGDVKGAVGETVRLRYWENIRESVRNWEEGGGVALQH